MEYYIYLLLQYYVVVYTIVSAKFMIYILVLQYYSTIQVFATTPPVGSSTRSTRLMLRYCTIFLYSLVTDVLALLNFSTST
jgi:hypothetical protein